MFTLEMTEQEMFVLHSALSSNIQIAFRDQEGKPNPEAQRIFEMTLPSLKWKVYDLAQKKEANGEVPKAEIEVD